MIPRPGARVSVNEEAIIAACAAPKTTLGGLRVRLGLSESVLKRTLKDLVRRGLLKATKSDGDRSTGRVVYYGAA